MLGGKSIIFFGWLYRGVVDLPEYDWLDVKEKRVLDVGASIGDTAVYFALRARGRWWRSNPTPSPITLR